MGNQQVSDDLKYHPEFREYSCDDSGNFYKNGKLVKGTTATTGYHQTRINKKPS